MNLLDATFRVTRRTLFTRLDAVANAWLAETMTAICRPHGI